MYRLGTGGEQKRVIGVPAAMAPAHDLIDL
jgi:hypothetical protein